MLHVQLRVRKLSMYASCHVQFSSCNKHLPNVLHVLVAVVAATGIQCLKLRSVFPARQQLVKDVVASNSGRVL